MDFTPSQADLQEKYVENRALRYKRQDKSALIAFKSTGHRVQHCMRHSTAGRVDVVYSDKTQHAYYSGLQTCGSVWDCPICSAKVSSYRAEEIKQAASIWRGRGGFMFMLTVTAAHSIDDKLQRAIDSLGAAVSFLRSGAPWQRKVIQYGIVGSVTGTEITYGVNGWHYHKHILFFTTINPEDNQDDFSAFEAWIYDRYSAALSRRGGSCLPGIGVKLSVKQDYIEEDYISKWGLWNEVSSSSLKYHGGIHPFGLLDDDKNNDLWIEYSETMKGRRQIVWSRGLRDMLGISSELSDQEVAERPEDETYTIHGMPLWMWKELVNRRVRDAWLIMIENAVEQRKLNDLLDHFVIPLIAIFDSRQGVFVIDKFAILDEWYRFLDNPCDTSVNRLISCRSKLTDIPF